MRAECKRYYETCRIFISKFTCYIPQNWPSTPHGGPPSPSPHYSPQWLWAQDWSWPHVRPSSALLRPTLAVIWRTLKAACCYSHLLLMFAAVRSRWEWRSPWPTLARCVAWSSVRRGISGRDGGKRLRRTWGGQLISGNIASQFFWVTQSFISSYHCA